MPRASAARRAAAEADEEEARKTARKTEAEAAQRRAREERAAAVGQAAAVSAAVAAARLETEAARRAEEEQAAAQAESARRTTEATEAEVRRATAVALLANGRIGEAEVAAEAAGLGSKVPARRAISEGKGEGEEEDAVADEVLSPSSRGTLHALERLNTALQDSPRSSFAPPAGPARTQSQEALSAAEAAMERLNAMLEADPRNPRGGRRVR